MTPQHRRRLIVAAAVTLVVLAFLTTPVFVSQGVAVGLGVMALSAIAPLIVLALVAYVWSSNDREAAKLTGSRPMQR